MCDCLNKLPAAYHPGRQHGDIERCPSCDTPWKLTVRRRGTFMTKEWDLIGPWDILARFRAAIGSTGY